MSMLIKRSFLAAFLVALLAACAMPGGQPTSTPAAGPTTENPYAPQPGDDALLRDSIQVVKTDLLSQETYPPQFVLNLSYFTPTPCHQFRLTVSGPDAGGRIDVQAYSLMKKNQVCSLMRLATPSQASLNLGSFPAGHYTIWVNGEKAAEFNV
ncbi:MAG TPA: hypothetical protein VMC09_08860 [Anaerolineales bacterium]|nr:hypothetical protein [Anaerolineales bacterium]